jgi:hypothetical protein
MQQQHERITQAMLRYGARLFLKCINRDDFTRVKDVLAYLPPDLLTQERVALLMRLNGSAVVQDWFETFADWDGVPPDSVYLSLLLDDPDNSIDRGSMAAATRLLGSGWTVRKAVGERGAWFHAFANDDLAWTTVSLPGPDEPGHITYNPLGIRAWVEHWQAPVVVLTLAWSGYGLDHTLADIHGLDTGDLLLADV